MSTRQVDRVRTRANGAHAADGRARGRVAEIQRVRILEAMTHVAAEQGVGNIAVAPVVARAGVSRRTFYEIFEDCEHCFLTAFDDAAERAGQRILQAANGGPWRERMRTGVEALLVLFDEEPHTARLLVVEALGAGGRTLEHRQRTLALLIDAVDEVRIDNVKAAEAPALTAEGVVGAVLSVLHARLLAGEMKPMVELLNPLMAMIVLPYLGTSAAERELSRPVLKTRANTPAREAGESPLKALEMRVTYRTSRVLAAVASRPGSSNRQIGEAAEMADQGQVSKLLGRLEKLGLVENTGVGAAARGAPNAWRLTERGWEVHGALDAEPAR